MIRTVGTRLAESGRSLKAVVGNPQLRRVEAARAAISLAMGMYGVVFVVLAYRAGGASAVGALAVVRMLTTATASPFGAMLGDRFPRHRVMYAADLFRAAVLVVATFAAASGPPVFVVFALGVCTAAAGTVSAPARAALIPSLARTPEQLAAANVIASTSEGVAAFAGPAIGGVLLAAVSVEAALLAAAAACLVSALLVSGIRVEPRAELRERAHESRLQNATAGFRLLVSEGHVRVLAGLYVGQTLATGVLGVVIVVAVIELLDLGEAGVGFASSVMAVGALLGAVAALVVVGGRGLSDGLVGGSLVWGGAVALVAAWPEPWFALVLFGIVGLADTVVDVCGITLLQRSVPDDVLARVFGALSAVLFAVAALGALIAPLLLELLGTRGALVVTGAVLLPIALVASPRLRGLEKLPVPEALASIRSVPFFAPLPEATLERLAAQATRVDMGAGQPVFEQGDPGDRFYVVERGEAIVTVDGREAARTGPGDFFGEIALLRDVPRTASVVANDDLELWSIERKDFLETLTAHPASLEAADTAAAARLRQALPPDLA